MRSTGYLIWRPTADPASAGSRKPVRSKGPAKERIMAKKSGKGPRVIIKMSSTESPYRFSTTKNKRNHPQRLELRRYDPVLRRHVLCKEEK